MEELKLDLGKNISLKDEASAHAQDAKKHMQKLSERTAQVKDITCYSHLAMNSPSFQQRS